MDSWPVEAPRGPSLRPSSSLDGEEEESDWEEENDAAEQRHSSRPSPTPLPSTPPPLPTSTSAPSSCPPISSLDDGALHHVLRFLKDPASLSAVGATSRRLRELVNDPLSDRELWKVGGLFSLVSSPPPPFFGDDVQRRARVF